jgi:hypothetical protein
VGQWQQVAEGGLGGLLQEPVTAGGHHHRVHNHDAGTHLFEPGTDSFNHRGIAEHSYFHGVDADVFAERIELLAEKGSGRNVDATDAAGVLGGKGGDGSHPVPAVGSNAFQVRLDAGAAGRIGSGDGEDPGYIQAPAGLRGTRWCRSAEGGGSGHYKSRRQETSLRRC